MIKQSFFTNNSRVTKGIRKSLKEKSKSSHSSISSPITSDRTASISSFHDIQINNTNILQSPKKVIKALYDYKPQGPGELEFQKGDFFHVIGNENDNEWYEACNPSKNLRGMVPVPYFEVFGKTRPNNSNSPSLTSPHQKKLSSDSFLSTRPPSAQTSNNALYGIVLYDFKAERSDELDVHIGENIILCAHHNYEWFIAKPIDRLGGPGLVPVSYISVINIVTGNSTGNDVVDDITNSNLPTVDEWKSKNAKYKASSIPLGDVDENEPTRDFRDSRVLSNSTTRLRSSSTNYDDQQQVQRSLSQLNIGTSGETLIDDSVWVIDASVDAFHVDNGRYWFHVEALFNNGEIRSLLRFYEDFYDFQIRLLELYPNEAGRSSEHKRILPFIPGPLTYVTDKITKKRQMDLNDYVKELISLPDYIARSKFVKSLFELKHEMDQILEEGGNTNNYGDDTLIKEDVKTLNHGTLISPNVKSVKLKFYYKDDIFALLIPEDIQIDELKKKINKRIYDDDDEDSSNEFKLFIKNDQHKQILSNDDVIEVVQNKFKILIDDE